MICRRCRTYNPDTATSCSRCGGPILRRPVSAPRRVPRYVFLAAGAAVLVIVYLLAINRDRSPQVETAARPPVPGKPVAPSGPSERGSGTWAVGEVVVRGAGGLEFQRAKTAAAGNWVAIPTWALFGGERLAFESRDLGSIPIVSGAWKPGDPVGLWRLEGGLGKPAAGLSPWRENLSLTWTPLRAKDTSYEIEIISPHFKGSWVDFILPEETREAGIFIQEGRIVGWTFGSWMEKGFLWSGPDGDELEPDLRADQFYLSAFVNCREAQFHRALTMAEGTPAVSRLEAWADGFRMNILLEADDLPPPLRPEAVLVQMHILAGQLIKSGSGRDVMRILDDKVLREAWSPALVEDAAAAVVETQGDRRAVEYMTRIRRDILDTGGNAFPGLDRLQARLYRNWLAKLIDRGDFYSFPPVFSEAGRAFPGDPEIHLLGVEAAIMEKKWKEARELLQARTYTSPFATRAKELEEIIGRQQEEAESIVITFTPGQKVIPIEAYLNGKYLQKFFVDTGASSTSIPSAAAAALGLKIDEATPTALVSTASGIELVYVVTLDSIEIQGHKVRNIKVHILDIPAYPEEIGLLGLNYLDQFRVELDSQKGILRLKKR